MLRYIVRRVLWGVALLVIVSAVVFAIFYIFPTADPAKLRAGRTAIPGADRADPRIAPASTTRSTSQFWNYMKGVFCTSTSAQLLPEQPDGQRDHLQPAAGDGLPGLRRGRDLARDADSRRDNLGGKAKVVARPATMVTTLAFISAPVFWLGLVALYLFAQDVGRFPIFPGIGSYNDAETSRPVPSRCSCPGSSSLRRRPRSTPGICARADRHDVRGLHPHGARQGAPGARVIMRHGVRSAITPIVTLLGLDVGVLLAGNAILTESVFNIPGIGKEMSRRSSARPAPDSGDRPLRRLLHRHLQPDRRHPLRLPRPAGALPVSLLEVQDLQVHFETDEASVKAVDGVSFGVEPVRRSGSSASRGAARASPT